MDPEPLSRLDLAAVSVVDDVGFVALADIASAMADKPDYRLIGGRMVQLHVQRWGLGPELYRETADADVGLQPVLLGDRRLESALEALGYRRESGNHFVREIVDIPVSAADVDQRFRAEIDVLVPDRGEPRPRPRTVGDWTVDVAPGLSLALGRPPVEVEILARRLNGERLRITCLLPDELSALALKLGAWKARLSDTDAVDVWRCLEILVRARIRAQDFESEGLVQVREALNETIRGSSGEFLARRSGESRGLNRQAISHHLVRLRALTQRITGEEP